MKTHLRNCWRHYAIYLLGAILAVGFLASCHPSAGEVPNSLPASSAGVDSAKDLNKFAVNAIGHAQVYTSSKGKPWVDIAVEAMLTQWQKLTDVQHVIAQAQTERDMVIRQRDAWKASSDSFERKYNALYDSWPCWIWRWCVRLCGLLIAMGVFHVAGGAIGMIIPGPIGAAISVAAAVVNPFTWFQTAKDNFWFRKLAPAKP